MLEKIKNQIVKQAKPSELQKKKKMGESVKPLNNSTFKRVPMYSSAGIQK